MVAISRLSNRATPARSAALSASKFRGLYTGVTIGDVIPRSTRCGRLLTEWSESG